MSALLLPIVDCQLTVRGAPRRESEIGNVQPRFPNEPKMG